MLQGLKKYIQSQGLCSPDDKLLVAVSGGIDSVILLDLLHKSSYSCAIAHCNFQLRGQESDLDEKFVENLGEKYGIITHTIRFDTNAYSQKNCISTQMAARELRYNWFFEITESFGYDFIAIAHNADDNIETFHLNLARGTGLSGITGISPKADKLIRPLLWAFRSDISQYCETENLSYREDSSNLKTNYKRNFLRHKILPEFLIINPSYPATILKNQEIFRQSSITLDFFYNTLLNDLVSESGTCINISIPKLLEIPEPSWFLFRYLSPFGFNTTQVHDINLSLIADSGKRFTSESHLLIKDREHLVLCELSEADSNRYYLDELEAKILSPVRLDWEILKTDNYAIRDNPIIAAIDADKIEFPLLLRRWHEGDYFYPLGMNKLKKLSDFFIDNKLSIIEKQQLWLITSGVQIVWIVGLRIDDRFKITSKTKNILEIRLTI